MTIGHPKPTRADRPRKPRARKAKPNLKDYYGFVRSQPCIVPNCYGPCQAHHVHGGVSLSTRLPLRRRDGLAAGLCIPACDRHHNNSTVSIHALGERQFERYHGLPEYHLLSVAASLLAAYVTGERGE